MGLSKGRLDYIKDVRKNMKPLPVDAKDRAFQLLETRKARKKRRRVMARTMEHFCKNELCCKPTERSIEIADRERKRKG